VREGAVDEPVQSGRQAGEDQLLALAGDPAGGDGLVEPRLDRSLDRLLESRRCLALRRRHLRKCLAGTKLGMQRL
jgi:hypothetical protein